MGMRRGTGCFVGATGRIGLREGLTLMISHARLALIRCLRALLQTKGFILD
jgi:hypothetical protein